MAAEFLSGRDTTSSSVYVLHCRSEDGQPVRFRYNPHTSELLDEQGAPVVPEEPPARPFVDVKRVSPSEPGRKSSAPRTLKIQLGLKCNYSCSYCNQASHIEDASVTRTAEADRFLARLDEWLTGAPRRIEFWGGEPFVYFAKLKKLVPALRGRFPEADMIIVTNGSLIDGEIIEFIERHDISIAVSHDGPGQHLRGPDPFDDPERAQWLRQLWRRRGPGGKMSFNAVFSPANCDVEKTYQWFAEKVGDPEVALSTEGAVVTYDGDVADGSGRYSAREYETLHRSMVKAFENGVAQRFGTVLHHAGDFIESLHARRPSSALGQKCGMDEEDQLAVDLAGNVMTCQNTGAKGKHGIGSVKDLDAVRLDTAWHWSHRDTCSHCPVLQLCKGSCMFLEDELFAQSCENEYRYNTAVLAGVIKYVTGCELERIEGDIRRPRVRRAIPIKALPLAAAAE
jgi:uncharacterized protein